MSFWKLFSRRAKGNFFDLLVQQGEKTLAGCQALLDFLKGSGSAEAVKRFEEEGDDIRRVLIDELHQTFITPIDREDIFALSRVIDDVVDYAKNTTQEMEIFEVSTNPHLCRMATLLKEGAEELHHALRHLEKHPNVSVEHAVRAKRIENAMNKEYLRALNELFASDNLRQVFCLREIYRHLNRSADRVDTAADIISDIVVKIG